MLAVAATVPVGAPPAAIELFGIECCYQMPAGSMKPTLKVGDRFALVKYRPGANPEPGHVVVFRLPKDPSTVYVKRIIGLPGDRVQMIDGALHLNGEAVKREQIDDFVDTEDGRTIHVKRWREALPNGASYETLDLIENGFYDNSPLYVVPDGHYFMLGDNRDNSTDSRVLSQVGYVPAGNIVGRMTRP